ncbi:hypothetical protein G7Y89_g5124 [Cudoniella acicularis]|uniref:Uncharacterized protein n=1 Tax=Cudoniella acicularis TaxID=354080 RepID=A0A8H4W4A4_9HELO|nr:hypothetical protein G7Y89_g5124 [Cudoniella acicularis]
MAVDPISLFGPLLLANIATKFHLRGRTATWFAKPSVLQKALLRVTAPLSSLPQPVKIAVAINRRVKVTNSEYKILNTLQGHGWPSAPEAVDILDQLWRGTRWDLQMYTVNGTHVLTDNLERYTDIANKDSRMETLEKQIKGLQRQQQVMCMWEMKCGFDRISKIIRPTYEKAPLNNQEKIIAYERNSRAHEITLEPILDAIDNSFYKGVPELGNCFAALFGVSVDEARAMLKIDTAGELKVEEILNYHGFLWKSGTCNKFVKPFYKWVMAMKEATEKPEAHIAVGTKSSLLDAAADASRCGCEDKQAAFLNMAELWANVAEGSKAGYIGNKQVYFWDNVKKDWENRGILNAEEGVKG